MDEPQKTQSEAILDIRHLDFGRRGFRCRFAGGDGLI
jgi:hypothetical protein